MFPISGGIRTSADGHSLLSGKTQGKTSKKAVFYIFCPPFRKEIAWQPNYPHPSGLTVHSLKQAAHSLQQFFNIAYDSPFLKKNLPFLMYREIFPVIGENCP